MENELEYKGYNLHYTRAFVESKRQFDVYENYFRKNILNFLPVNKTSKIVDFGCGLGHFLYFLKKNGYTNISGIDLVKENVEGCKENGFNVKEQDLFDYLSSTKEKSDVFILNNILEHFSYTDIVKIIDSLYILLNEEGTIIVITPNCNNIAGLATYFSDITHKSPLTEKSFEDLISKTNVRQYSFHNLIVFPNIFLLDQLIKGCNYLIFLGRKMNNLLNGQKPFKVQSKNLLTVLKK